MLKKIADFSVEQFFFEKSNIQGVQCSMALRVVKAERFEIFFADASELIIISLISRQKDNHLVYDTENFREGVWERSRAFLTAS